MTAAQRRPIPSDAAPAPAGRSLPSDAQPTTETQIEEVNRVVVAVARHETLTYTFGAMVDPESAIELIESCEHDPTDSNIRSEDIDLISIATHLPPARSVQLQGWGRPEV
jgi:hypothetical protein